MRTHLAHPYLLAPQHKITVHLVGVGGTGSQVLSALARMHKALQALGHTGLHVRAFDPDTVSDANIGRQMYSPADVGLNKAVVSISRINRFFGYNWEAYPQFFDAKEHPANLIITCVDTAAGRLQIGEQIKTSDPNNPITRMLYWLDFGNLQTTGQVVLGTTHGQPKPINKADAKSMAKVEKASAISLPVVTEMFDLKKIKEVDQGPSCSLAEALGKQDLFINSTLANLGCNILWKLFRFGKINHHGLYLNLDTLKCVPIPV